MSCVLHLTHCRAEFADFPQYMEKRVFCQLNGNRKVIGVLRGYDVRFESLLYSTVDRDSCYHSLEARMLRSML